VLFPVSANAIPGHQDPAHIPANPAHRALPGNRTPLPDEQDTRTVTDPAAEHPQLTTGPETVHNGKPEQQDTGPTGGPHCGQGLASGKPHSKTSAAIPCLDTRDQPQRFSVQLGQRAGSSNGILGELDGVRLDYRLSGGLSVNGIAGFPVRSATDNFNVTRQVFGLSVATGPFARAWDLTSYLVEQQENDKAYDRAVGGALRNRQPGRSLLVFLDYDLADDSLGALMASGAWRLFGSTTISATLDLRRRPPDARQKTYLQHSMSAIAGWNRILPVDRLAHHTAGGSGEVSTMAVGWSHALSPRLKLIGDVAVLDAVKDTAADDASVPETKEYFYHLKLTGKGLLLPGDSSQLDLRHSVREGARISSATIDTRYTISRDWNITPAVRADYRRDRLENTPRWAASPSVKMEYRWRKQHGFRIKAGGTWSTGETAVADNSRSPYYLSLGYETKF
jgi:hypothetical protein